MTLAVTFYCEVITDLIASNTVSFNHLQTHELSLCLPKALPGS